MKQIFLCWPLFLIIFLHANVASSKILANFIINKNNNNNVNYAVASEDDYTKIFVQVVQLKKNSDELTIAETYYGDGKFPRVKDEYVASKQQIKDAIKENKIHKLPAKLWKIADALSKYIFERNIDPSIIWKGVKPDAGESKDENFWEKPWTPQVEQDYSLWIRKTYSDPDFYKRIPFPTNCADIVFSSRWIYAALKRLPIKFILNGNKILSSESFPVIWKRPKNKLNNADELMRNKVFKESLLQLLNNTFTFDIPKNSYGINIRSKNSAVLETIKNNYLKEGTINLLGSHSMIISKVDLIEGHLPLQFTASTLPTAVRSLSIYPFAEIHDLRTFNKNLPIGLRHNIIYNPANNDEDPFEDLEISTLLNMFNIKLDLETLISGNRITMEALLNERKEIIEKSKEQCLGSSDNILSCLIGSQKFEYLSTPGRDMRLKEIAESVLNLGISISYDSKEINEANLNINDYFNFTFHVDSHTSVETKNILNLQKTLIKISSNPLVPKNTRWMILNKESIIQQLKDINETFNIIREKAEPSKNAIFTLRSLEAEIMNLLSLAISTYCEPLKYYDQDSIELPNFDLLNNQNCLKELHRSYNLNNRLSYPLFGKSPWAKEYKYNNFLSLDFSSGNFDIIEYKDFFIFNDSLVLKKDEKKLISIAEFLKNPKIKFCSEINFNQQSNIGILECLGKDLNQKEYYSLGGENIVHLNKDKVVDRTNYNDTSLILTYQSPHSESAEEFLFSVDHAKNSPIIHDRDNIKFFFVPQSGHEGYNSAFAIFNPQTLSMQIKNSGNIKFSINIALNQADFNQLTETKNRYLIPIYQENTLGDKGTGFFLSNNKDELQEWLMVPPASTGAVSKLQSVDIGSQISYILNHSKHIVSNATHMVIHDQTDLLGKFLKIPIANFLNDNLKEKSVDNFDKKEWNDLDYSSDGSIYTYYNVTSETNLFYFGHSYKLPNFPFYVFNSSSNSFNNFAVYRIARENDLEANPNLQITKKYNEYYKFFYISGKGTPQIKLNEPILKSLNPFITFSKKFVEISDSYSSLFIKQLKTIVHRHHHDLETKYEISEPYTMQKILNTFIDNNDGTFQLLNQKLNAFDLCDHNVISKENIRLLDASLANICDTNWVLYY